MSSSYIVSQVLVEVAGLINMECSYELAEAMLKLAEKELRIIHSHQYDIVELSPHIANAVEYLAKALIYAINVDEKICKETRKRHDVSGVFVKVFSQSPIPLSEDDVKAIAGIAFLNAMLCNNVIRAIVRYGVEPLGILFHEATRKTTSVLYEWKELLEHVVKLLDKYYNKSRDIVRRAGTFVIEVTKHSFSERRDGNRIVKHARILISKLRPTAKYAHARVRIRLCEELLDKTYKVLVKFKAGNEITTPVRCEVCLWDRNDRLANDDGTGSPRDYVYLAGGEDKVVVYAGRVDHNVLCEIEPRVWKPGGIKTIEVIIEEEIKYQN